MKYYCTIEQRREKRNEGKDVKFIQRSNIPNVHTPDIHMDGLDWEIKCPQGSGRNVMAHNFIKALAQSRNIIIDLRRCSMDDSKSVKELKKLFKEKIRAKKLLIIMKNGELIANSR